MQIKKPALAITAAFIQILLLMKGADATNYSLTIRANTGRSNLQIEGGDTQMWLEILVAPNRSFLVSPELAALNKKLTTTIHIPQSGGSGCYGYYSGGSPTRACVTMHKTSNSSYRIHYIETAKPSLGGASVEVYDFLFHLSDGNCSIETQSAIKKFRDGTQYFTAQISDQECSVRPD